MNLTVFLSKNARKKENKNNIPVNIRFVSKTSHIRNFSQNIKSDVKASEMATLVITERRSGLRRESTIFAKAGAGSGVRFLNENRTRSWSWSENFSFYRFRIINFIKFKFSLNG